MSEFVSNHLKTVDLQSIYLDSFDKCFYNYWDVTVEIHSKNYNITGRRKKGLRRLDVSGKRDFSVSSVVRIF